MRYKITNMKLYQRMVECDVDGTHFCFPKGDSLQFWKTGDHKWMPRHCGLTLDLRDALIEEMNRSIPLEVKTNG